MATIYQLFEAEMKWRGAEGSLQGSQDALRAVIESNMAGEEKQALIHRIELGIEQATTNLAARYTEWVALCQQEITDEQALAAQKTVDE